jgi:hypothetical protein
MLTSAGGEKVGRDTNTVWKMIMTGKCDCNCVIAAMLSAWKPKLTFAKKRIEWVQVASVAVKNQDANKERRRLFVYPSNRKMPALVPDPKTIKRADYDDCFQTERHRIVVIALDDGQTQLVFDAACAQYGVYDKIDGIDCPAFLGPETSKDCLRYLKMFAGESIEVARPEAWEALLRDDNDHEALFKTMLSKMRAGLYPYLNAP